MPSLREDFPWQERDICETNQESSPDVSSVKETEKSSRVTEPFSTHVIIKSNSAPWDHGSGNRNVFSSERSRNSAEDVVKGNDGVYEHCRNEESLAGDVEGSRNLAKDVIIDGKRERKRRDYRVPIELTETNENFDSIKYSPSVRRNVDSIKYSAGRNGLNKLPWEKRMNDEDVKNDMFGNRKTVLAERSIPEHELKRLRNVSLRMVERIKVGAAGVTQALVDAIHEKWKDEEVVKLRFEGPPSKNMKRTHEFLEVAACFDIVLLMII